MLLSFAIVKRNTLIVLLGPTGVGKTDLSIWLSKTYNCPIISSDSRQIFSELKIGVAAPSAEQLLQVPHYFIGTKHITEPYSAGQYELDVLDLLDKLFSKNSMQLLVGGSMLYIDAVCNGLDNIPPVKPEVREKVHKLYEEFGLEAVRQKLKELDPAHYEKVDLQNKQRVIHALEVCLTVGKPYSKLLSKQKKKRPFDIIKIGLNLPRPELYERINKRVDIMMDEGLLEEVTGLYPYKNLNSLNTVGYKEIFDYLDKKTDLETAVALIKQNSRRYAKRQLTWFNADAEIRWFAPNEQDEIISTINRQLAQ